jgi:uncharacterized protein (UPF0332 family)
MNKKDNRENVVKFFVDQSFATFDDAKFLADGKRWKSCLSRLYYACFYMVYALLTEKLDIRIKTHVGVKNLFNEQIVRVGLIERKFSTFYSKLMERRGEGDYADFEILTEDEVLPLISQAEEFIKTVQKLILSIEA